jgi:hypothetical protein
VRVLLSHQRDAVCFALPGSPFQQGGLRMPSRRAGQDYRPLRQYRRWRNTDVLRSARRRQWKSSHCENVPFQQELHLLRLVGVSRPHEKENSQCSFGSTNFRSSSATCRAGIPMPLRRCKTCSPVQRNESRVVSSGAGLTTEAQCSGDRGGKDGQCEDTQIPRTGYPDRYHDAHPGAGRSVGRLGGFDRGTGRAGLRWGRQAECSPKGYCA